VINTNEEIRQEVLRWLETGETMLEFSIIGEENEIRINQVKMEGRLEVLKEATSEIFLVDYETITPLHGSGVDKIITIKRVEYIGVAI